MVGDHAPQGNFIKWITYEVAPKFNQHSFSYGYLVHANNNHWYPFVFFAALDTPTEINSRHLDRECSTSGVQCASHSAIHNHDRQGSSNTNEGEHYHFASRHLKSFVDVFFLFVTAILF